MQNFGIYGSKYFFSKHFIHRLYPIVQHFLGGLRCCTLGATGVYRSIYGRGGINFATKSIWKRIYSRDGVCWKHKFCHIFEPFYILYFLSSKPRVMRNESKIWVMSWWLINDENQKNKTTFHIEDFEKPIGENQFVSCSISDKNLNDSKSSLEKSCLSESLKINLGLVKSKVRKCQICVSNI